MSIFAGMKKKTIWTIAVIMGFSFLALLFLQLNYIQEMVDMKKAMSSISKARWRMIRSAMQ